MKVFVYGSLLSGFGNHPLLEDSRMLGETDLPGPFKMVSLGAFPGVLTDSSFPSQAIKGEVYKISDETLRRLDWLEGHPNFYKRSLYMTADLGEVYVYLLQGVSKDYPIVESGDWREYCREQIRA